jgi:two-component system, LytTR family, sensor kinase
VSRPNISSLSGIVYWTVPAIIWGVFYSFILEEVFNISFAQSMVESAVANVFLIGTALVSLNISKYYTPSSDRIFYMLGIAALLSAVVVSANLFVMTQLLNDFVEIPIAQQSKNMLGGFAFLINSAGLGFSLQLNAIKDSQETKAKHQEAENLNKEAELLKLRHQLQPHFLFNSLNSINALITIQPKEARKMVQQLSEFLRGTIRADEHNLVSIENELKHLDLYLKIEKVRFGHRLNTVIDLDENANIKTIPSLLLQPLMENAIKFGLYGTTDLVDISLKIASNNNMVEFIITNPIDGDVKSQSGTGFGLASIHRRLYLLYGRTDLLTTSKTENTFSAMLKIPQNT